MGRDTGWVLDLDGVLWLGDQPIPGAAEAVGLLRCAGRRLAFVTNNSYPTRRELQDKLERNGIDPGPGGEDLLTSAMAAASLVEPGERALLIGGPGVEEALHDRNVEVVHDGRADAVVVGLNPRFDYSLLTKATGAISGGARLIATNDDATYPMPDGPIPGAGAILASIVTASGATPQVAGKPCEPISRMTVARLGDDGCCVGDRPETDGRFARALGYRFVLVLSGVTTAEDLPVELEPDGVYADLAAAVRGLLAG